jgi:hypothetical protein
LRRIALFLLLAAAALRCWDFGNPVIHVDEQYYLLVADRMLRGAVPFVDLWDRKPVGLFLHFAAIRLLPGDGVLAYQLVATAYAAATAVIVAALARRVGSGPRGALAAGLLYLVGLGLLGGRGGQSPVFYDLYMALGALLVLRLPATADPRAIVRSGLAACLLAGVAIQCKYTPAVEGAFFGLAYLHALHRAGARPPALAGAGALWLAAGLLPTLAAAGWYAAHGRFDAWWFANLVSIGLRPAYPPAQIAGRLLGIGAQLAPLAAAAWSARSRTPEGRLAAGWLAAALVGFLAVGTYFDHYALPLLAPLCTLAAPALDRPRWRRGLIAAALALFAVERVRAPDDAPGAREVARLVRANAGDGCPYVFLGDTVTYLLADACLPTPYAFPNLLAYTTERGATGIDEAGEVRRILAARPPAIVWTERPNLPYNPASLTALRRALGGYRPVYRTGRANGTTTLWLRRDLPFRS